MDKEKARELWRRIGHVSAELCVCLSAYIGAFALVLFETVDGWRRSEEWKSQKKSLDK